MAGKGDPVEKKVFTPEITRLSLKPQTDLVNMDPVTPGGVLHSVMVRYIKGASGQSDPWTNVGQKYTLYVHDFQPKLYEYDAKARSSGRVGRRAHL